MTDKGAIMLYVCLTIVAILVALWISFNYPDLLRLR